MTRGRKKMPDQEIRNTQRKHEQIRLITFEKKNIYIRSLLKTINAEHYEMLQEAEKSIYVVFIILFVKKIK